MRRLVLVASFVLGCRSAGEPDVPSNQPGAAMRPVETAPAVQASALPPPATSAVVPQHLIVRPNDTPPPTDAPPYKPGSPTPTATGGGPKVEPGGAILGDEKKGNAGPISP